MILNSKKTKRQKKLWAELSEAFSERRRLIGELGISIPEDLTLEELEKLENQIVDRCREIVEADDLMWGLNLKLMDTYPKPKI